MFARFFLCVCVLSGAFCAEVGLMQEEATFLEQNSVLMRDELKVAEEELQLRGVADDVLLDACNIFGVRFAFAPGRSLLPLVLREAPSFMDYIAEDYFIAKNIEEALFFIRNKPDLIKECCGGDPAEKLSKVLSWRRNRIACVESLCDKVCSYVHTLEQRCCYAPEEESAPVLLSVWGLVQQMGCLSIYPGAELRYAVTLLLNKGLSLWA